MKSLVSIASVTFRTPNSVKEVGTIPSASLKVREDLTLAMREPLADCCDYGGRSRVSRGC